MIMFEINLIIIISLALKLFKAACEAAYIILKFNMMNKILAIESQYQSEQIELPIQLNQMIVKIILHRIERRFKIQLLCEIAKYARMLNLL